VSASQGWRSTQALIAQQAEALLDALEARLETRLRSEDLARFRAEHGVTPFVLDAERRVLAHPDMAQVRKSGDPVLARLDSPDGGAPLLRGLTRSRAVRAQIDGRHYLFITREMATSGGPPWTIGVYLDPVEGGQRDAILRVVWSIAAGLGVLVVAVSLAAVAGRRIGRPIEALARAARAVRKRISPRSPTRSARTARSSS